MIDFNKAKQKYNSTEIPRELDAIVEDTIKQFERKQKSRTRIRFIHIAPVAACAVICVAVGISTLPKSGHNESVFGAGSADAGIPEVARSLPASGAGLSGNEAPAAAEAENAVADKADSKRSMYNMYVAEKIDESIEKSVRLENSEGAHGKVSELYSDENVYSYCVTTYPSNTRNYYNIKQNDGAEIMLEDILRDVSGLENCEFYFKSASCIVVICDGIEKEIILG